MVDTMSKQRTHYEVLGLTSAATGEQVERAFARQFGCFQPQTVGRLAEVTVAYEVLRNPAKRRAYDASLGLKPEEAPRQPPMTWRIGGQVMTATAVPAIRPAIELPTLAPSVKPEPEPTAQPEVRPFIAASNLVATLDELASPEPLARRREPLVQAQTRLPRLSAAEPTRAPVDARRLDLALDEVPENAEDARIPWKQAGIVVGAVALGVALLGAWAGWESVSSAEPAENATQAVIPPRTTYTVSDPAAAAPDQVLDVARPTPVQRPAHAARPATRVRPTARLADLERDLAKPDMAPLEAAADPATPAEAPVAVAASMPLSNHVIARTIQRIGYPCGQIASTAQSGTPGVFKVTCTSGHSYQAAPVRGRYHFRRLGGG